MEYQPLTNNTDTSKVISDNGFGICVFDPTRQMNLIPGIKEDNIDIKRADFVMTDNDKFINDLWTDYRKIGRQKNLLLML